MDAKLRRARRDKDPERLRIETLRAGRDPFVNPMVGDRIKVTSWERWGWTRTVTKVIDERVHYTTSDFSGPDCLETTMPFICHISAWCCKADHYTYEFIMD